MSRVQRDIIDVIDQHERDIKRLQAALTRSPNLNGYLDGASEIDADNITSGQLAVGRYILIGTSFPGTADDGQLVYRTDLNEFYRYDLANTAWIPMDSVHDPLRLGDGIVSATHFATGLEPVRVVAALPDPGDSVEGWVVVLTTDGKLYRFTGGTWTAEVPATDLTGQLAEAQIADEAISASKIAAGLAAVQVVASLPADATDGEVVLLTTDYKLYRWDGAQWIAEVASTDIVGDITATGIPSGSSLPGSGTAGDLFFLTTDDKLYRYDGAAWTAAVATTDLTGTILEGQIEDGAVSTDKFATGLEPVQVVAALPGSGTVGEVVLLTTDQKLYRWTGSVWTATVPATDLTAGNLGSDVINTGSLNADNITAGTLAAGIISTTALNADNLTSGSILAARIATTALDADNITAGSLSASIIATTALDADNLTAGAIHADRLTTTALDADNITTGTLVAGILAAGAIGTTELAAESIYAKHLVVSNSDNHLRNGDFRMGAAGEGDDPGLYSNGGGAWASTTDAAVGDTALKFTVGAQSSSATVYLNGIRTEVDRHLPVSPGETVTGTVQAKYAGVAPTGLVNFYVLFMDEAGATVQWAGQDLVVTTGFTEFVYSKVAPANATYAVGLLLIEAGGNSSTVITLDAMTMRKANDGHMIVDGAITASKILAGEIETAHMSAGTIATTVLTADWLTAGAISTGAISTDELAANAVTTIKMEAGTIDADRLISGSITADLIGAGEITADKIDVTDLNAVSTSTGSLTVDGTLSMGTAGIFQTAASGKRLIIDGTVANRQSILFETLGWGQGEIAEVDGDTIFMRSPTPSTDHDSASIAVVAGLDSSDASLVRFTADNFNFTDTFGAHIWAFDNNEHFYGAKSTGAMLIRAAIGTASAPAYTFYGDTDTGIFRVSADILGIAAGGADIVEISSGGWLRMGPSLLGTPLLTKGAGSSTAPVYTFSNDNNTGMYLQALDSLGFVAGGSLKMIMRATDIVFYQPLQATFDGTVSIPAYSFNDDPNTGMYRASTDQIGFAAGGVGRVTISTGYMQDATTATAGTHAIRLTAAGTAAVPTYSFNGDANTGIYRYTADQLGISAAGVLNFRVTNGNIYGAAVAGTFNLKSKVGGTVLLPTYAFNDDPNTGMYRVSADRLGLVTGGNMALEFTSTLMGSMYVYNSTSGTASNMVINSSGWIQRSTASSRRYKKNIKHLKFDGRLRPRSYNFRKGYVGDDPEGEERHFYFIAEEVLEDLGPEAVEFDNEGRVDDVRVKAITAALSAQINRLEDRLAELEKRA